MKYLNQDHIFIYNDSRDLNPSSSDSKALAFKYKYSLLQAKSAKTHITRSSNYFLVRERGQDRDWGGGP